MEEKRKKIEEKKMSDEERRKVDRAKAEAQAQFAKNNLKIVMPQDEELETSNRISLMLTKKILERLSDCDKENDAERAMRLQGRRDEIRAFLQMNQEKEEPGVL